MRVPLFVLVLHFLISCPILGLPSVSKVDANINAKQTKRINSMLSLSCQPQTEQEDPEE